MVRKNHRFSKIAGCRRSAAGKGTGGDAHAGRRCLCHHPGRDPPRIAATGAAAALRRSPGALRHQRVPGAGGAGPADGGGLHPGRQPPGLLGGTGFRRRDDGYRAQPATAGRRGPPSVDPARGRGMGKPRAGGAPPDGAPAARTRRHPLGDAGRLGAEARRLPRQSSLGLRIADPDWPVRGPAGAGGTLPPHVGQHPGREARCRARAPGHPRRHARTAAGGGGAGVAGALPADGGCGPPVLRPAAGAGGPYPGSARLTRTRCARRARSGRWRRWGPSFRRHRGAGSRACSPSFPAGARPSSRRPRPRRGA